MTNRKYSALLALGVLVSMTACGSSDPGVTNAEDEHIFIIWCYLYVGEDPVFPI